MAPDPARLAGILLRRSGNSGDADRGTGILTHQIPTDSALRRPCRVSGGPLHLVCPAERTLVPCAFSSPSVACC
jgi:hypothetical protein